MSGHNLTPMVGTIDEEPASQVSTTPPDRDSEPAIADNSTPNDTSEVLDEIDLGPEDSSQKSEETPQQEEVSPVDPADRADPPEDTGSLDDDSEHPAEISTTNNSGENSAVTILAADPEQINDIKEFPSLPSIPAEPGRRRRRTKRTNSLALSISSISTSGQQAVSSSVFLKTALVHITTHKSCKNLSTLKTSGEKAIGKYNCKSLASCSILTI